MIITYNTRVSLYKSMKKISILLFLILAFAKMYAVNLSDSYKASLSFNADYLSAIASNDANQEAKVQARSSLLPQIAIGASFSENFFQQYGTSRSLAGKPVTDNMYTWYHQPIYSANLTQTIFDFTAFSSYVKSKYFVQISNLQLENAKQKLLVQTAQAYFDVLFATSRLEALKANKMALEQQMKQAQKSFEVGTSTIADVNDAKAALDAVTAATIKSQNDLIDARNNYSNITGINPDQIHDIKDKINIQALEKDCNAYVIQSLLGNIDVLVSEQQVNMANMDLLIARGGYIPTLALSAGYTYTDTGGFDKTNATQAQKDDFNIAGGLLSKNANSEVQLELNIPIYNGGVTNSKVREASAKYVASRDNLLQLKRNTDRSTQNAFWLVQNGAIEVKAEEAALKSAKIKLESDKLGYKVGVRNSIDLVNSQNNYTKVWQEYQQARYQFLMAKIQLRYLIGDAKIDILQDIDTNIT
jgi:outer membrane protein